MPTVERKGGSLLVGVALSEPALWLPVIEKGRRILGSRALNARMLEPELERLLSRPIRNGTIEPAVDRAALKENAETRRKILECRIAALPLHLSSYDSLDARRASFDQLTAALAKPQPGGKESRRESGRFERAERGAALGNRRTA